MKRNSFLDEIRKEIPQETRVFVQHYADIVIRINQLLSSKGWSQKELADRLGKQPSEISKWLSGEHNFTLRSIAKLEAELGESIIHVPMTKTFVTLEEATVCMTVYKNKPRSLAGGFEEADFKDSRVKDTSAA